MSNTNLSREQTVDKNGKVTHVYRAAQKAKEIRQARIERLGNKMVRDMTYSEFLAVAKKDPKFKKFSKLINKLESYDQYTGDMPATDHAAAIARDIYDNASRNSTGDFGSPEIMEMLGKSSVGLRDRSFTKFDMNDIDTLVKWEPRSLALGIVSVPRFKGPTVRLSMDQMLFHARHHVETGFQNEAESVWLLAKSPLIEQFFSNDWGNAYTVGEVTDFLKNNPEYYVGEGKGKDSFSGQSSNISYHLVHIAEALEDRYGDGVDGRKEALKWMGYLYSQDHFNAVAPTYGEYQFNTVTRQTAWTSMAWDIAKEMTCDQFLQYYDKGIDDIEFIKRMHHHDIDPSIALITFRAEQVS